MKEALLYYATAGTTAIAGILHLLLVPNIIGFNVNSAIFFLVSGIAQIFWVLPMVKRWGKMWYYIGIAGTYNTHHNVGHYENARKSYYRKRRTNKRYGYSN